ncbi:hypothetical protein [Kitasatospora mediocidica]|uniref:hypothetical protein n=1 Tax=Kitasatospora mediocidica TaxID=58352 RepID=UPI000562A521|nr:hypothetical protein [Kitasatospora mediocidica]
MPDPCDATTAQELVRQLRAFKAWSGDPSLREIERRTGLPRSTTSGDLSPQRNHLPPLQRVLTLATAFGASGEELARWRSAWQRIQMRQHAVEPRVPSAHAALAPTASDPDPVPAETAPEAAPRVRRAPERTGHRRLAHRRLVLPARSLGGLLATILALPLTATPAGDGSPATAGNGPAAARRPDPAGVTVSR